MKKFLLPLAMLLFAGCLFDPELPETGSRWTVRSWGGAGNLNMVIWTGSQLVAVGDGREIIKSPDGITWSSGYMSYQPIQIKDVVWKGPSTSSGPGLLVAVGELGKIFSFSEGGYSWTERNSMIGGSLSCVAWTGRQLVAVSASLEVITSPNGIDWTWVSNTPSAPLSLAWTGKILVAVGNNGTVLTSPEGITWTAGNSGTVRTLRSVIWTGNQLAAVGDSGTFLKSPDGIAWMAGNINGNPNLRDVTWARDKFVVVGAGDTVHTSPDGKTWTSKLLPGYCQPYSVTWTGSQIVAVGFRGVIVTSP